MTNTQTFQPNNDDLELLSAYLDRQLTAQEQIVLEARLEREPALRQMLEELRATVSLLQALPPARPPRSFTLDPAKVQPRRNWWGWMAALPIVAVLAIALLFSRGSGGAASMQMAAAPTAAPAAPTAASVASANNAQRIPAATMAPAPTSAPAATMAPAAIAPAAPMATAAPAAPEAPTAEPTVSAAIMAQAAEATPTPAATMEAADAQSTTAKVENTQIGTTGDTSAGAGITAARIATPEMMLQPGDGAAPILTTPAISSPDTTKLAPQVAVVARPNPNPPSPLLFWVPFTLTMALLIIAVIWWRRRRNQGR